MLAPAILDSFQKQADACDTLGSPFTARLCRLLPGLLDATTATGRRVSAWPGKPNADALPLRLTGALHALVLSGRDAGLVSVYPPSDAGDTELARAVGSALALHDDLVLAFIDSPPQTNETGRAAMLLPGFLTIARESGLPLSICEIGASAGLNLSFDRFHYDYAGALWGPCDSAVRLAPDVRNPPPLGGTLEIKGRSGCDIAPVDVAEPTARQRLRAYVWADQTARLARLDAAIALATVQPVTLERADAADFVARQLAARRKGRSSCSSTPSCGNTCPKHRAVAFSTRLKPLQPRRVRICHWPGSGWNRSGRRTMPRSA